MKNYPTKVVEQDLTFKPMPFFIRLKCCFYLLFGHTIRIQGKGGFYDKP